ncbi:MAG: energy-coupling factor transporter transmembrane component T [Peptoniphilus lacydonensis]|uniref:energy-coupling factor transporter transmembrane component T family protein n=1 Tax=Peptoniphilus lacydonensis TaxID=1673725 RepID=UPI002586C027|nr:energy-coupling factor transporter transmembrane component T [Peptoniphilus lacydonensis]MDU7303078.1 energy-coupling factor transporter transmembrane component T [Peptoniphilus lacydonensis]
MPTFSSNAPFNPNPISKILVVFLTGLTVMHGINIRFELAIVCIFLILFYLNGYKKTLFKWIVLCGILYSLPNFMILSTLNPIIKMFLSIPIVIRMFILPFMAASLMIKTSDVGTIISSMDKLKISKKLSIPIAVMFRFFPSFKEEKKNIKMAMRVRGINFKNPIEYIEYVSVPLLIISSNIADDIAKAAETKAIENPIAKTRYIRVKIQLIDFVYVLAVAGLIVGGLIWLK